MCTPVCAPNESEKTKKKSVRKNRPAGKLRQRANAAAIQQRNPDKGFTYMSFYENSCLVHVLTSKFWHLPECDLFHCSGTLRDFRNQCASSLRKSICFFRFGLRRVFYDDLFSLHGTSSTSFSSIWSKSIT